MTLAHDQRLRRRADFDAVMRDGVRAAAGPLSVIARPREAAERNQPCRFGFAISRRVGGAVQRNRIKRRLRASARALNARGCQACQGLDVVVSARPGAAEAAYETLDRSLEQTLRRLQQRIGGAV